MNNTASWADELDESQIPEAQVIENQDGTKTVIEYRIVDGKKVKLTRRIKEKIVQEHVNRAVAERKKWAKFGAEKGTAPGPNIASTTLAEQVSLRLSQFAAQKQQKEEEVKEEAVGPAKNTRILCRVCRGDHFTAKCPYKDTLVPMEGIINQEANAAAVPAASESKDANAYVPPHMRGKTGGTLLGESREKRDEFPTIRITNLSEDVREQDIRDLCKPFGYVHRAFVAIDRVTGDCKGYAFVSFIEYSAAEKAIDKLSGFGYDSLILKAEWANSSGR
ncbi:translation initiation factor eIF3 subunit g [Coemansia spiralis]|uniref:Eukaryotic translation initiation factor 3 subunit G n=2 Tax=Coemansia TaxID=4863 RepID=A0A9W8G648_9FUNG|nr:translation initiation factor eIF3 subunit g [Coemansia umbellata]KAJ2621108.1 translation initiation factor eIF3 subunit g [Coemansia sp. RSA 1358]KAJ2675674.1 translation initiation factor eIF3 subunit g [Coemansia spiralis]